MWRWLARGLGFAAAMAACGEPARPGFVPDLEQQEPPDDSLVDPAEPPPPPSYSPCGAATVQLEFVRPNLYFALDASGSMLEGIANTEDPAVPPGERFLSYRYAVLATAVERLLERVGHRVSYGATLFPTADVTCDAGEEILELTAGDAVSFAVSGETGPVLERLMWSIRRRSPRGGTPVADTLRGLVPKLTGRGDSYVFLITDGGPNCALGGCGPEACIPNIERQLITQTERCIAPLNCCDGSLFGPDSCLDSAGSKSAVDALAEVGVRTFVIGMPGSEVYADVLDQLAESGGLARAESPKYYRVGDGDQLIETVSRLGRQVALGCSIELATPPPDAGLVNVYFDGTLVPSDPVDGWIFNNETTIQLTGEACRLLSTGEVLQADIVAGCPIVVR
jgi:hypothetical protein